MSATVSFHQGSGALNALATLGPLPIGQPSEDDVRAVLDELDSRWGEWGQLAAVGAEGGARVTEDAGDEQSDFPLAVNAELDRWAAESARCHTELTALDTALPAHIDTALNALSALLTDAQSLALGRYALADELTALLREVFGDERGAASGSKRPGESILATLETLQDRLGRLDVARQWAAVLEHVMALSQEALAPIRTSTRGNSTPATPDPSSPSSSSSTSSPLHDLRPFKTLHRLVHDMHAALPVGLALLDAAHRVRSETWRALREALSTRLLEAADGIGWPKRIDYPAVPAPQRKAFEAAFRDMLAMQHEADKMGYDPAAGASAEVPADNVQRDTIGLYPLVALLRPVALRFQFHFEGTRGTNRLDKPEWAFSSLLDFLFEQRAFTEDYLQPLIDRSEYRDVDAKSELIQQLLPIPLAMLTHRFPHLLPHPSLLAHTVYQTVVFDDAIRADEYDPQRTLAGVRQRQDGADGPPSWRGLTEALLGTADWFERWLEGERQFADEQFAEAISSAETWTIADADAGTASGDAGWLSDLKPTIGARQVQALLEQVTDRYVSLPSPRFKLPFLLRIQLPLLEAYRQRLTSSLDAFETLSSSFLRAVPGALAGHARENGLAMQDGQMTSGTGGLQRLCKAWVSAAWMKEVLDRWNDEPHFVEFAAQVRSDSIVTREARNADSLRVDDESLFGLACERYAAVAARAEDMIVKHVAGEVERDLRPHLTRRWDKANGGDLDWQPDASLLTAMSALSSQLGLLARTLPLRNLTKQYRSIVAHLSNHIMQRAVHSGWSKFTEAGGKDFATEVGAWTEASVIGLGGALKRPNTPWTELAEAASILALPQEPQGDDRPSFSQAMALAFGGDTDRLRSRLGLRELSEDRVQAIMRRRLECWR